MQEKSSSEHHLLFVLVLGAQTKWLKTHLQLTRFEHACTYFYMYVCMHQKACSKSVPVVFYAAVLALKHTGEEGTGERGTHAIGHVPKDGNCTLM